LTSHIFAFRENIEKRAKKEKMAIEFYFNPINDKKKMT
jgi:hypothetical protein